MQRRALILMQAASALAAAGGATARPQPQTPAAGTPQDFDFLAGEWRIANRRRLPSGVWDEFPGEATVTRWLDGAVSLEELRIPARDFAGMGLRIFDPAERVWRDLWMNAKQGVVQGPGVPGRFQDGVGLFESEEQDQGQKVGVRGIWDRIGPHSCRWRQSLSRDGGRSWDDSWVMHWTRA